MAPFTVDELRMLLSQVNLDTRGNKATLSKRLRNYNKKVSNANGEAPGSSSDEDGEEDLTDDAKPVARKPRPKGELYDSFLVLDVEASCDEIPNATRRMAFSWPNEIIEFPVVLLSWVRLENDDTFELRIVDTYRSLVKPVWRSQLSPFCIEFTGIKQSDVEEAPTFERMLQDFEEVFIKKHDLFTDANETVWVCDGPWDLRDFVAKSCYINRVKRPWWLAGPYIDIRIVTSQFFDVALRRPSSPPPPALIEAAIASSSTDGKQAVVEAAPETTQPKQEIDQAPSAPATTITVGSRTFKKPATLDIESVLSALGMSFEGRAHCGIDDARNIARILMAVREHHARAQSQPSVDNNNNKESPREAKETLLVANRTVPEGGPDKEKRYGWMKGKGKVDWDKFYMRQMGIASDAAQSKGVSMKRDLDDSK